MEIRLFFTIQCFTLHISGSFGGISAMREITPSEKATDLNVSETNTSTAVTVRIFNAGKEMKDIEKRIVSELSWPTRLLLLKDYGHKHYPGMTDDENDDKVKEEGKQQIKDEEKEQKSGEKQGEKEKQEDKPKEKQDEDKEEDKQKEKQDEDKEEKKQNKQPGDKDDTRTLFKTPIFYKKSRRNFKPRGSKKILIVFVTP